MSVLQQSSFKFLTSWRIAILKRYCLRQLNATATTSAAALPEKTALYDFHIKNNGKMVNFAGYLLPVQYSDLSIAGSHLHTRNSGSIFDVSHMLQTYVKGKDCVECLETVCTADIQGLDINSGTLTVFTNKNGKILDDLIVSKISSDCLYIVSNAAMKKQDMDIMTEAINKFKSKGKDVSIEFLSPSDRALLAVQGPKAVNELQKITKFDLSKLYFMTTTNTEINGVPECRITRCGYTGEDGFEISIPGNKAAIISEALLANGQIRLAGLGARDSLRLEAGLCLYGTDIDANTSPIEAGLAWLVAKRRRIDCKFPGADIINNELKNGVTRRRIGFRLFNGPPARHNVEIYSIDDHQIGTVTSGCPSPSLGGSIGMGYINENYKKIDTEIKLKIRDKFYPTKITKMPFVASKYYLKPK